MAAMATFLQSRKPDKSTVTLGDTSNLGHALLLYNPSNANLPPLKNKFAKKCKNMSLIRYYTPNIILLTKGHGKGLTRQRLWLFSPCVSGVRFKHSSWHAQVAELVDALASGASDH